LNYVTTQLILILQGGAKVTFPKEFEREESGGIVGPHFSEGMVIGDRRGKLLLRHLVLMNKFNLTIFECFALVNRSILKKRK
jgi:hypothetical protein